MQLIGKRSHDDEADIEADRRSSSHETLAEEYDEYAPLQTLTDNELVLEKQLRKRIDCVILPMVFFVYLLNGIDRYVPRTIDNHTAMTERLTNTGRTLLPPVYKV